MTLFSLYSRSLETLKRCFLMGENKDSFGFKIHSVVAQTLSAVVLTLVKMSCYLITRVEKAKSSIF